MAGPEQVDQSTLSAEELGKMVNAAKKRINELARRADAIRSGNPLSLMKIRGIDHERRAMKNQYLDAIDSAISISSAPLSGPGAIFSGLVARQAGFSTMHVLLLQAEWNDLGGIIDRKSAYAIALISIYISICSIILSVVLFFLSR